MQIKKFINENINRILHQPKPLLMESIYRIGSDKHIENINLVKEMYKHNQIELNGLDKWLITETNAGEYGFYENEKVPLDIPFELYESDNKKPLNKPFRLNKEQRGKGKKKYGVYVKDGDKVKIVKFGHSDHKIKIGNKEDSKSYAARHKCQLEKDKTTPNWWSCNITKYYKLLNLTEPAYRYW